MLFWHLMAGAQLVLGIDLGGTKINTALVDRAGAVLAHDFRATSVSDGPDAVIGRMIDASRQVITTAGMRPDHVQAAGVCAPGPLDVDRGLVLSPPNLPGWDRIPLTARIADALAMPVHLENDANAAALGENRFGAGRGARDMVYVTASTGIGGGLILDGHLYHGASGLAGEIGHQTVLPHGPVCGCGNRGCLESLASGTAIARRGRESVARGVPTVISELAQGDSLRISAKLVAQAAERGDSEARMILSQAMDYLGIGMANLVNLLNPELIVIGGGLTKLGDMLFDSVRRAIDRIAFPMAARAVRVVPAALGDDVGALGAAALALGA
jgi:glucokinase